MFFYFKVATTTMNIACSCKVLDIVVKKDDKSF
jgi:hypothetical protein